MSDIKPGLHTNSGKCLLPVCYTRIPTAVSHSVFQWLFQSYFMLYELTKVACTVDFRIL